MTEHATTAPTCYQDLSEAMKAVPGAHVTGHGYHYTFAGPYGDGSGDTYIDWAVWGPDRDDREPLYVVNAEYNDVTDIVASVEVSGRDRDTGVLSAPVEWDVFITAVTQSTTAA